MSPLPTASPYGHHMDTERAQGSTATAVSGLPVDVETISATIRKALRFGSIRPSREELAATDEALRGHVALLLAEARRIRGPQPPDPHRIDRIEKHLAYPLGKGMLSADAEVPQRARDCQWLLAYFTASRNEYRPTVDRSAVRRRRLRPSEKRPAEGPAAPAQGPPHHVATAVRDGSTGRMEAPAIPTGTRRDNIGRYPPGEIVYDLIAQAVGRVADPDAYPPGCPSCRCVLVVPLVGSDSAWQAEPGALRTAAPDEITAVLANEVEQR